MKRFTISLKVAKCNKTTVNNHPISNRIYNSYNIYIYIYIYIYICINVSEPKQQYLKLYNIINTRFLG
jgi:hypothetical protein